jgi:hypothetical protein
MKGERESGHGRIDPDQLTAERAALRDLVSQIYRLARLWNDGFLTDAEYEAMKAKLIGRE